MSNKKVVVFCSASRDIDPRYNEAAREVVRALCLAGYDIVSGGTTEGTMNVVCETASENGAEVIGIIPRFMSGLKNSKLTECVWTDTMSQRKELMREGTSLAVALPGGIGTLDELAETYCLAKMGLYKGRIIVLNMNHIYDAFKKQIEVYVERKMMVPQALELISFPETVDELIALLGE